MPIANKRAPRAAKALASGEDEDPESERPDAEADQTAAGNPEDVLTGADKAAIADGAGKNRTSTLDYMLAVVADPTASKARRDAMAKAATPYVHSRLSPIAPATEQDTVWQKRMKEAADSVVRKIDEFEALLRTEISEESDE